MAEARAFSRRLACRCRAIVVVLEYAPERMDTASMHGVRILAWLVIGSGALGSAGCLQTLVGAMIAPESVAAAGASGGVNALASAVSGEDLGSMTDVASTAADIDRILAAHPDAVNRPELEALRDELKMKSMPEAAHHREGSAAAEPDRLAERDRRVTVPIDHDMQPDALVIETPPPRKRGPSKGPEAFPEPTNLDCWQPQWHVLDTEPVRLR